MKTLIALAAGLIAVSAVTAEAKIPLINGTCPTGIEVHADEGGPVFINGHKAKLKKYADDAYDASHGGVTVSLSINPDGTVSMLYTGKHGANGVCQVRESGSGGGGGGGCPADVSEANRYQYPDCN